MEPAVSLLNRFIAAKTQVLLGVEIPVWLYVLLLFVSPFFIDMYLNRRIAQRKFKKKATQRLIMKLNIMGTFLLMIALGSTSTLSFGPLPAVMAIFNPWLGFIPIYIAYHLQVAIHEGRIR
ncbi:MAG: hypothetical protein PHO20_00735 [Candidatus Peribacteraceae bacterium]|nr:hypothetical protein [Candidatus Peribacteraceae bacterium]MDD5739277.1 hypothetical protein [Candidatus Peribacteraceae bacterium]